METRDVHDRLVDNVPIVVEDDGSLHHLSMAGGITLDEMTRELRAHAPRKRTGALT